MKQFIVALVLILLILASALGVSAFINRHCDVLETEAISLLSASARGDSSAADAAKLRFEENLSTLFSVLYFTANHHDLTALEVSFQKMLTYAEAEEYEDAQAALIELRDSLRTLRMTEQVAITNIF